MKRITLVIAISLVFTSCDGNRSERATDADTTATSTTPPARQDTNPIGIMMGDTTIGINDSLKNGSPKK
jgi:PBP1b-binding outer membrane lipoprotein LpoB